MPNYSPKRQLHTSQCKNDMLGSTFWTFYIIRRNTCSMRDRTSLAFILHPHCLHSICLQYSFTLCYRYAASVVTSFTYGRSNHISYADPSIKKVVQCAHRLGETARPGQYLVDAFPVLNYAPGWIYWPLQELRRWHREELELFKGQMDTVRKKKVCLRRWDFTRSL